MDSKINTDEQSEDRLRDERAQAMDDAKTPTKASFASGPSIAGQQPLPSGPFPPSTSSQKSQSPDVATNTDRPRRDLSQNSKSSTRQGGSEEEDIDMDEQSDGEAGSGDESVNNDGDGSKSGKKKKSQRFYCTDYPPCNLSFTRSEHLARHVR